MPVSQTCTCLTRSRFPRLPYLRNIQLVLGRRTVPFSLFCILTLALIRLRNAALSCAMLDRNLPTISFIVIPAAGMAALISSPVGKGRAASGNRVSVSGVSKIATNQGQAIIDKDLRVVAGLPARLPPAEAGPAPADEGAAGLPARDASGLLLSLILSFLRCPSVSVSLPEPAGRALRLRPSLCVPRSGLIGREFGAVEGAWGLRSLSCFFLCFLRELSLPSVSDKFGDPGRLRLTEEATRSGPGCLAARPEGVLLPLGVLVPLPRPDAGLEDFPSSLEASSALALSLPSFSFCLFSSSGFCSPVSESESLYKRISKKGIHF